MTEALVLPVLGLVSDPGPFTAAPEGSLIEAQNVVILRPGVVEPRPGVQNIVDATMKAAGSYTTQQIYSDAMDLLFAWANDGSTWLLRRNPVTITGPTSFTIGKINVESTGGRALFTSNNGVCTLPSQTASPASGSVTVAYRSGMPQPYAPRMITATAPAGYPAGANWLPNGESVAYRVTLRRRLANGTIVESAPSGRVVVTNSAGAARAVLLTDVLGSTYFAWYPGGVLGAQGFNDLIAGDELCVYRSPRVAGTPSDEMKLRSVLTWDAVSFGFVNWYDALDDSAWTGAALYTNETQEGAAQANYRPEYARDIALYNGMTFYAGAKSAQRVDLTLKKVSATIPTDPSQALNTFGFTGNVAIGTNTILNCTNIYSFSVGQVITTGATEPGGVSAFPANTQVTAINVGALTVTVSANSTVTAVGIGASGWDWVETSVAGSRIYHSETPLVTARWFSAQALVLDNRWNGDLATSVQLRCSAVSQTENILCSWFRPDPNDAAFSVRSSKPYAWDRLCDSVTGVASKQFGGVAELTWSKTNEPEHVPIANRTTIGDAALPIRRILVAKNSLLIFKDDGLFQCFGQTPNDLAFELLDRTILIPPPPAQAGDNADPNAKWAARYDDRVYIMSTRGPMAVTDGGGALVGAPILETLRYNLGDFYGAGSNNITAMVADVSARRMIYFANGFAYVHDVDTGSWVMWTYRGAWISAACIRPAPSLATMSVGVPKTPWIMGRSYMLSVPQFRIPIATPSSVSIAQSDVVPLSDSYLGLTANVLSVTGTGPYTVTIAAGSEWTPAVGDYIVDGVGNLCLVTDVTSATVFSTEADPGLGARDWYEGYESRVIWIGNAQGNVGVEKQAQSVTFAFDSTRLLSRYVSPTESLGPIKAYFRGYRNADTVHEYINETVTNGSLYPYPVAPRLIVADVPRDLASDWAIQIGFTVQQAGCWFSTSGLVIDYADAGEAER